MDKPAKRTLVKGLIQQAPALPYLVGPILLIFGILIVLFLSIAGVYWYMAYGVDVEPPGEIRLASITDKTAVAWQSDEAVTITASDSKHMLVALGFIHATRNAWQVMLWRQTANGNLSTWFGPGVQDIDRFSRQLRFQALARETFQKLSPDEKRLLRAYAEGINAAYNREDVFRQDEFAVLDIEPEPWNAWDALAVERLFAWLSTKPLLESISIDSTNTSLLDYAKQDLVLRNWLQIHSFENSFAGVIPPVIDGAEPTFYHRLTYGASSLPLVQEIQLEMPGYTDRFLASLPGSPIILMQSSAERSWAWLPASNTNFLYTTDSLSQLPSFERIENRDGSEELVTLYHRPGSLSFIPDPAIKADSVLQLSWPGFSAGTDIFSFLKLIDEDETAFTLQSGNRLTISDTGWAIEGNPSHVVPLAQDAGVIVGSTIWLSEIAAHIDSLAAYVPELLNPQDWPNECYSRWAEQRMSEIASYFFPIPTFEKRAYFEALTYLRNWDFRYDAASIGASIFSNMTSRIFVEPEDALDSTRVLDAFEASVDELLTKNGADLSQWRYEVTNPIFRYYPVWESDSLFNTESELLSENRFAALQFAGKGHASTLCWGFQKGASSLPISARWASWQITLNGQENVFWNKHMVPKAFLDRYLIVNRPGMTYRMNRPSSVASEISWILPLVER